MIAAGEVVERPASVVKELLENSVDAGADRIEITVKEGGKKLIQVSDNGKGMGREDIALAMAAHATSKLENAEDLFNIHTLGFRGEALASISRVSKTRVRSNPGPDRAGWEISVEGNKTEPPHPCSASPGTTVTVENLFSNVPARRKFLKKEKTEFGHVTEQLIRISLPHPEIAFFLRHDGRETMKLPTTSLAADRVSDIFDCDFAASLMPISPRSWDRGKIEGFVGPVSSARSSAKWQYVFLNGRFIRDRLISHAIREAYRGRMDPRKYPVCFLFIEVDPGSVDVNVHPTKTEVRFRDGNEIHSEVYAALNETLLGQEPGLAAAATGEPKTEESAREALLDFFKNARYPGATDYRAPSGKPGIHKRLSAVSDITGEKYSSTFGLMQIHNSYIVVETDKGLEIYDQHALHERILYNRLKNKILDAPLPSQPSLIPPQVSITAEERETLEQNRELLHRLGIDFVEFGTSVIAIQQFPSLLVNRGVDIPEFIRELVTCFAGGVPGSEEAAIESVISMMACKAAVKAGDPLKLPEMQDMISESRKHEKSGSCPHGRPSVFRMTLAELQKHFDR